MASASDRLLAQRGQLVVAGARVSIAGRVGLAEGLDEIAEHAGLDGARDELRSP